MTSQRKADPVSALNYDCLNLEFQKLSLQDLARAEQVSTTWKSAVEDWASGQGLLYHFPDVWKKVNAKHHLRTTEGKKIALAAFKQAASEKLTTDRWLTANPKWAIEYGAGHDDHETRGISAAGNFIAWGKKDPGCIFYQRVGYQPSDDGSRLPYPVKKLNLDALRNAATYWMYMHAGGLLYVTRRVLQISYMEHVFDLETGKELWSKEVLCYPTTDRSNPWHTLHLPAAIGWERLYRPTETGSVMEAYDLRTGALLYSIPWALGFTQKIDYTHVWRLQGREIIVVISVTSNQQPPIARFHLIDAQIGHRIQLIEHKCSPPVPGASAFHDPLFYASTRRGELSFAVVEEIDHPTPRLGKTHATIQIYDYDAPVGQFVARSPETLSLRGMGFGSWHFLNCRRAYDPFRRFLVDRFTLFPFGETEDGVTRLAAGVNIAHDSRAENKALDIGWSSPERISVDTFQAFRIGRNRLFVGMDDTGKDRGFANAAQIVEFGHGSDVPPPTEDTLVDPNEDHGIMIRDPCRYV
ncbi:uncharacterized protein DSM5745_00081 [Aspergillus mulundensis]|uniref:F-box domain-containing protein n=1 Tax=Aspergillus mulundensis TaxID=1810919 RepID=A0A3D8T2M0_9EURO|nr:hypothetical protein DSM5745_00081 [Aspergillus mulundensis]RDW92759.1 hypothetical protein DSM5745_00081 [Aspergillus mulundensis]